jgi:hypothetical protein
MWKSTGYINISFIGWKKTFLLVIVSGIAGEFFGAIFNNQATI